MTKPYTRLNLPINWIEHNPDHHKLGKQQPFYVNDSNIKGWTFLWNEGEGLPPHDHKERPETAHITVCISGKLKIIFPDEEIVLEPGDVYDLAVNVPHELRAVADNTLVMNIIKV